MSKTGLMLLADFSVLAAGGIAVHSFDAHGHGKSEPAAKRDRVYVNKFSDLVSLTLAPPAGDMHCGGNMSDAAAAATVHTPSLNRAIKYGSLGVGCGRAVRPHGSESCQSCPMLTAPAA